jgi:hypothetical protein
LLCPPNTRIWETLSEEKCWHLIFKKFLLFFFWQNGGLNSGLCACKTLYCLSHATSPFCSSCFGDGVLPTICLGWTWSKNLPISASQVPKITGVSHQHLACCLLKNILFCFWIPPFLDPFELSKHSWAGLGFKGGLQELSNKTVLYFKELRVRKTKIKQARPG